MHSIDVCWKSDTDHIFEVFLWVFMVSDISFIPNVFLLFLKGYVTTFLLHAMQKPTLADGQTDGLTYILSIDATHGCILIWTGRQIISGFNCIVVSIMVRPFKIDCMFCIIALIQFLRLGGKKRTLVFFQNLSRGSMLCFQGQTVHAEGRKQIDGRTDRKWTLPNLLSPCFAIDKNSWRTTHN